ncbi:MAG: hypothetical protein H0W41_00100 [Chloroflexi bacterium]|nr:hypothetical protein [Chloroflexota bacterium]
MTQDPGYCRNAKQLTFRLSETVYAELLRQIAMAPIPYRFGLPWYVRRLLAALPMPEVPPAVPTLVDAHALSYLKRLAASANEIAKAINEGLQKGGVTADQVRAFCVALDDLVTYLLRIKPAGYVVVRHPVKRYRVRELPIDIPSGKPVTDHRLKEIQSRSIKVHVSLPFADEVARKARAFGGGQKGMLSQLLRAVIMGERLPPIRKVRRDPNDNYAFFFGSRLRGHLTQMINHLGGEAAPLTPLLAELSGLRKCVDAVVAYVCHRADLTTGHQATPLMEAEHRRLGASPAAQPVDRESLRAFGLE